MGKKSSRRKGAVAVFGVIALVYLVNLGLGGLPDDSPWQYAAGGAFLVASGAALVWLEGRPTTLRLDRARNTCRLSTPRQLFSAGTVETFPLDLIRAASVNEVTLLSHDGPSSTGYEVRLETKDRRAVTVSLERSRRAADGVARRIRDFLKGNGDKRLTVRRVPWLMLAVGGAFVVWGTLLISSALAGWPYAL
ncbi:MAG TPA: hypothetical protein VK421_16790 [Pyrinomonadaceae bacterium]|nr:hypothetical protein [Pyrinomonadaceae bacterium]